MLQLLFNVKIVWIWIYLNINKLFKGLTLMVWMLDNYDHHVVAGANKLVTLTTWLIKVDPIYKQYITCSLSYIMEIVFAYMYYNQFKSESPISHVNLEYKKCNNL